MSPSPTPIATRRFAAVETGRPSPLGRPTLARRPLPGGFNVVHRPRPAGRHALETVSRRISA